jgi:hypothetical protein
MFVRLLQLSGDRGALDELTRFVSAQLQPALDDMAGSMGLAVWVDRYAGDAIVASVWSAEADMAASELTEAPLRAQAAKIMGCVADVERYEAALVDALRPVRAGNVMRLLRIQAAPAELLDHVAWSRLEVIPVLHRTPGYLSYFCGVDQGTGRAVAMSTYHDRTDADIALMTTATLRSAAADRGVTVEAMRDYEVVIADISITLPPLPSQRSGDSDRDNAVFWTPATG